MLGGVLLSVGRELNPIFIRNSWKHEIHRKSCENLQSMRNIRNSWKIEKDKENAKQGASKKLKHLFLPYNSIGDLFAHATVD